MLGTFVSKTILRSAKAVCSCTILCLNLKTVNCTRRGLWDRLFGQGFDSPHLHQQVMDRSDAILFLFYMGRTDGEGDLDRKEEARSKGVFYIRRSQGKTRTDEGRGRSDGWVRHDLRICHLFILTLIDIHDTIQIENIRYYKRRYQP